MTILKVSVSHPIKMNKRKLSLDEDIFDERVFSISQKRALKAVLVRGQNIFISGSWKSGKSECIHQITKIVNSRGLKVATVSYSGEESLCSFMGFDAELLKSKSKESICNEVLKRKFACSVLQSYRMLIIDDISFVDSFIFEVADYTLKKIRNSKLPFGGLQIVLLGDFYQLCSSIPFFKSDIFWKTIDDCRIIEDYNHTELSKILNHFRKNEIIEHDIEVLKKRINVKIGCEKYGIKPTILRMDDVDHLNEQEYEKLKGQEILFKNMKLKIGCQVMLCKQIQMYKEGSRGILKSWSNDLPVVQFVDGKEITLDPNVGNPLKLAWFLNAKNCVSFSLDAVELNFTEPLDKPGMVVFLLSRIKNLESLTIKKFPTNFHCDLEIFNFYEIPFLVQKAIKNHATSDYLLPECDIGDEELVAFTLKLNN